jgi:hypothetical protein
MIVLLHILSCLLANLVYSKCECGLQPPVPRFAKAKNGPVFESLLVARRNENLPIRRSGKQRSPDFMHARGTKKCIPSPANREGKSEGGMRKGCEYGVR